MVWINYLWSDNDDYIGAFLFSSKIKEISVNLSMCLLSWQLQPISATLETVVFASNLLLKMQNLLGKPGMNKLLMVRSLWICVRILEKLKNRWEFTDFIHDVVACVPRGFSIQSTLPCFWLSLVLSSETADRSACRPCVLGDDNGPALEEASCIPFSWTFMYISKKVSARYLSVHTLLEVV